MHGRRSRGTARGAWVLAPFAAFVCLFLAYPTLVLIAKALAPGGTVSLASMATAMSGTYRAGFVNSTVLSLVTAVIGGVLGIALALAVAGLRRPAWLPSLLDSWSAVASQLGGVPLAFAFIATIGAQGVLTKAFGAVGIDSHEAGLAPTGFWGLVVVYLYFQIPLMFLVMMPAIHALRPAWREAAATMGCSAVRYWRSVGIPVLAPSALGGIVLLFVNSFTAYATAYVLNPGGALVPLQIRFVLQGNVISGEQDLGYAIVTWIILLLVSSLLLITWLQRRTLRWMAS